VGAKFTQVIDCDALLGLTEVGVAIPVVEAGTNGSIGVASREGGMTALKCVVLHCGDKPGHRCDAVRSCVEDDDRAEMLLADGLARVDTNGSAEAFERPLM
jgi:hypothetical protein